MYFLKSLLSKPDYVPLVVDKIDADVISKRAYTEVKLVNNSFRIEHVSANMQILANRSIIELLGVLEGTVVKIVGNDNNVGIKDVKGMFYLEGNSNSISIDKCTDFRISKEKNDFSLGPFNLSHLYTQHRYLNISPIRSINLNKEQAAIRESQRIEKIQKKLIHKAFDTNISNMLLAIKSKIVCANSTAVRLSMATVLPASHDADTCAICLEVYCTSKMVCARLTCGHVYHFGCVFNVLKKKNACPLCRHLTRSLTIDLPYSDK